MISRLGETDTSAVLESILDRLAAGETLDEDALVREHPSLRVEIRQLMAVVTFVQRAAASTSPLDDLHAAAGAGARPVLDDYEIVREIGRGGMGVVYEAHQRSLDRHVALKVLLPGFARGPGSLQRFLREARTAGALAHRNIVPVYAVGEDGDVPYYAMPFVEGRSLAQIIDEPGVRGADHVRRASEWCRQIADALAHAHRHHVVHRDVKPSNILIDAEGRPWITDFGLARHSANATITLSHDLVGTVRYMAPEQARGGSVVDERCDVYGLGATLYELLAARPIFAAENREVLIKQVLLDDPVPLSRCAPHVPEALATIVRKAVAREPQDRYPSAALMAEDLARYQCGRPLIAQAPGAITQLRRVAARHRLVTGLLTTLVFVFVTLSAALGVQAHHLWERQEDLARQASDAAQTSAFFQGVIRYGNPRSLRYDVPMREVLALTLERAEAELAHDPDVAFAVLRTIAQAYQQMGEVDEARRAYEKAIRIGEATWGRPMDDRLACAAVELAEMLRFHGETGEASAMLVRLLADLGPVHPAWPSAMLRAAMVQADLGHHEDARRMCDEAIDAIRARDGAGSPEVADALMRQSDALGRSATPGEQVGWMREVIAIRERALGADHPLLPESLGYLASALLQRGEPDDLAEAQRTLADAIDRQAAVKDADAFDTLWLHRQLAGAKRLAGDPVAGLRLCEAILPDLITRFGTTHHEVGVTWMVYGRCLQDARHPDQAIRAFDSATTIFRDQFGDADSRTREAMAATKALEPCDI